MEAETIKTRKLKVKENNKNGERVKWEGSLGWAKLPRKTVSVWLCSAHRFPHEVDTV